jgi:hypothetical protein
MSARIAITTGLLGLVLAGAPVVSAQSRALSQAECRTLRERLADHARLSDGVRRALAAQVGTAPAAAPAPEGGRAEAIRSRLAQIPGERQALEEQRLGAMMRLDLSRAAELQSRIKALDTEKSALEREQAGLPVSAPATPAPAPAVAGDASRVRCDEVAATLDAAVKIRQRELGAREGQAGVVPLVPLRGQSSERIAEGLAAQLAPEAGAPAGARVGLLDADGDGRIDGVADAPAPGVYRLVRRRSDGTISVEAFATGASGAGYGDLTRRLDEATLRQTGETLESVVATRPAGPIRVVGQTGEFERAQARLLAGDVAEAARVEGAAARSVEFENYRGDPVRVVETISPVSGGVHHRRLVVLAPPNARERWEETATVVRPVSYWRTDVEVTRSLESRTPAGALAGTRSSSGPFTFSLER